MNNASLHVSHQPDREPQSIWLLPDKSLEMRFSNGDVEPLPDTAVGSYGFNGLSRRAWKDATDRLLRIAMLTGWEEASYREALQFIRAFPAKEGVAMQVYPE